MRVAPSLLSVLAGYRTEHGGNGSPACSVQHRRQRGPHPRHPSGRTAGTPAAKGRLCVSGSQMPQVSGNARTIHTHVLAHSAHSRSIETSAGLAPARRKAWGAHGLSSPRVPGGGWKETTRYLTATVRGMCTGRSPRWSCGVDATTPNARTGCRLRTPLAKSPPGRSVDRRLTEHAP